MAYLKDSFFYAWLSIYFPKPLARLSKTLSKRAFCRPERFLLVKWVTPENWFLTILKRNMLPQTIWGWGVDKKKGSFVSCFVLS